MGDRNRQRACIAQVAGLDHQIERIEEIEAIDRVVEFEAQQCPLPAEQPHRTRMLRVTNESRVVHTRDAGLRLQPLRQLTCVLTRALHAQHQRLGADGDSVGLFGAQCRPEIAQPLLADLLQPPAGRVALAIGRGDVRIGGPVEQPRVRHRAPQCIAVTTDRLGQRVDHQRRTDGARPEQRRCRHRVVDDVDDAPRRAQRSDALEVGDLRDRIRDRLDEYQAGVRPHGRLDGRDVGRVGQRDLDADAGERAQQARRVAEQIAAGHDMIAMTQQCQHHRTDRGHAGGKAHGTDRILEQRHLGLERSRGGVALASVDVSRLTSLEHGRKVARGAISVGHRGMHRLVHGAVLDLAVAIRVQKGGGDASMHDESDALPRTAGRRTDGRSAVRGNREL